MRDHGRVRLYLSSFRIGGFPEHLKEMAGEGREAIVIANACDAYADVRDEAVERELTDLADLGFRSRELDLRDYFGRNDVGQALAGADLVWVRGGSAFVLRKALELSAADSVLVDALASDSFVYGGYSAGVCVLGRDISFFETVDDRVDVERAYREPARDDGLGVIDFIVVPHVDSPGHPETEQCTALSRKLQQNGIEHFALRDGDVVVADGDQTTLFR